MEPSNDFDAVFNDSLDSSDENEDQELDMEEYADITANVGEDDEEEESEDGKELEESFESEEEPEQENRIGNVPLSWYDEFDHIGYNIEGQKIMRPKKVRYMFLSHIFIWHQVCLFEILCLIFNTYLSSVLTALDGQTRWMDWKKW